jgi:tetratricopeptide (TPR) repeat protein
MISPTRLFRIASRVAEWATPHVKEWHRKRHEDQTEGQRHLAAKNYSEAEKHLSVAAELADQRHVAVAKRNGTRLELAVAQREQKKFDEAEANIRIALENAGRDRQLRGAALESLADLQLARGNQAGALEAIAEAAELPSDGMTSARRTHKMAKALAASGEKQKAIEAHARAVELHEEAISHDTTETAIFLGELGAAHRELGNHTEAQVHLRRAVKIFEHTGAADTTQASESIAQLATSLEASGDLDGALAEFERALRLKERQIGGNMEEMAELQARAARMYVKWGERGKARNLLAQAIPRLARTAGPRYIEALESLAEVEAGSGRKDEADRIREKIADLTGQQPV